MIVVFALHLLIDYQLYLRYCKETTALTIDHVIPISRGGKWEWENLVSAPEELYFKAEYHHLVSELSFSVT